VLGLNQFPSQFRRVAFGLPIQLGYEFDRPNVRRRVAVTIEAPRHGERLDHPHLHHLVDRPWQLTQETPAVTCA